MDNLIQRFRIDFFELCILTETCLQKQTGTRATFINRLIDEIYFQLTSKQRLDIFNNIISKIGRISRVHNKDLKFLYARFDPDSQYNVSYVNENQEIESYLCYWLEGKYYKNSNTSLIIDKTTEIVRL